MDGFSKSLFEVVRVFNLFAFRGFSAKDVLEKDRQRLQRVTAQVGVENIVAQRYSKIFDVQ